MTWPHIFKTSKEFLANYQLLALLSMVQSTFLGRTTPLILELTTWLEKTLHLAYAKDCQGPLLFPWSGGELLLLFCAQFCGHC